jgi:hypothetical protein
MAMIAIADGQPTNKVEVSDLEIGRLKQIG